MALGARARAQLARPLAALGPLRALARACERTLVHTLESNCTCDANATARLMIPKAPASSLNGRAGPARAGLAARPKLGAACGPQCTAHRAATLGAARGRAIAAGPSAVRGASELGGRPHTAPSAQHTVHSARNAVGAPPRAQTQTTRRPVLAS